MIDHVHAELPPGSFDACPAVQLAASIDERTGEVCDDWSQATFGQFKIRVHNRTRRTYIKGSLHKYWSETHNGGPFPRWAVGQAVHKLARELDFDPAQAVLRGLEFGANVPMPTPTKELLRRAVRYVTKGAPSKKMDSKFSQHGLLIEVETQQYFGKGYDKEEQLIAAGYPPPGVHLFRPELKVRKMQLLAKAGVKTLADLNNPATLEIMGQMLLEHLNSIVFAAPGELPPNLRTADRRLLRDGARVGYWDGLPPARLRVQMKKYRKLSAQYIVDEALEAATQGLRSVWQQLLNEPAPVLSVATVAESSISQVNPLSRGLTWSKEREEAAPYQTAEGLLARLADNDERGQQPTTAARCCQTCGRVLTSSSSRAKFCSEREWGPAAKKCRNADSNPRNNAAATRRKIMSQGPLLFDDSDFIRVPEPIRAFVLAAA